MFWTRGYLLHRVGQFVFGVLMTGLVIAPAYAQGVSLTSLDQALAAGNWQQADSIAVQLDSQAGQGDIMAAYAASVRHAANGQCQEATVLADLVIGALPFFVPHYLVSYRCHAQLGRNDVAAERLTSLQAILPAGPERDLVGQLLRDQESRDRPSFSGYAGVVPSTNVNRQTGASEIDGGLWGVGQIPEEARGQRGVLFQLGGAMTVHLAEGQDWSLSGVLRTDIRYSTADETFEPSLTAELPVNFALAGSARAVVAPYVTIGFENDAHVRTEAGVRNTLSIPITAQQRLSVNFRAAAVDRPLNPERNGAVIDGAVSLTSTLTPNLNLTTTARAIYNHTDDQTLSTLEATGTARLDAFMDGGLLLGLEGTAGQRFHARPAPFELDNQVDTFVSGRIDASHREITVGPFMPSIYYEYTNSWSDNVFYTYDSHDVGVTLRASF